MLVRSNVRITDEFSNFFVTFVQSFGILLRLGVFKKGMQGGGFLYATGY